MRRDRLFDSKPHKEGTMPASKKKRITAEKVVSTSQPSSPELPQQQEFQPSGRLKVGRGTLI
jgi:hypothetical protein